MKRRFALIIGALACWVIGFAQVTNQPQRLLYFPDSGRSFSALDPGQELLQRNLLISNQASGYGVSFSLSFDKSSWNGFALGPRYSSIFSLNGQVASSVSVPKPAALPRTLLRWFISSSVANAIASTGILNLKDGISWKMLVGLIDKALL